MIVPKIIMHNNHVGRLNIQNILQETAPASALIIFFLVREILAINVDCTFLESNILVVFLIYEGKQQQ